MNIVKNKFVKLSSDRTKYINEQEFQFSGLMKIMAFLMSGAFKKQSMKNLTALKILQKERKRRAQSYFGVQIGRANG